MNDKRADKPDAAKGDPQAERKARLAANLRANLRRRKSQAREMDGGKSGS